MAAIQVDDRWARAVGITGFAVAIPHLTGLLLPPGPSEPAYWLSLAYFVLLSAAIWHGNRWLLFKQREHLDWFGRPVWKVIALLFGIVCFTVPLTVSALALFAHARARPLAPGTLESVTVLNVLCVVFVAHVYETVFLIKERASDMLRVERLERMRAQAELAALEAQVDPHFLFNSLNTLSALVEVDPAGARAFIESLARVYRHVLRHRHRALVALADELLVLEDYRVLLGLRFGDAIRFEVAIDTGDQPRCIPMALQLLVENAVKHNRFDTREPMIIEVRRQGAELVVENPRRPRHDVEGEGFGLAHLRERVEAAMGTALRVEAREDRFVVRLPLAIAEAA